MDFSVKLIKNLRGRMVCVILSPLSSAILSPDNSRDKESQWMAQDKLREESQNTLCSLS
jgi:hypothetical protein